MQFSKWVYFLFLASLAFLVTSIYYFNMAVTDKLLTPEESRWGLLCSSLYCFFFFHHLFVEKYRLLNRPCVMFDYFDHHDVWHFLSAIGIFLLLILLYVLDLGLESYPRSDIKVF